MEVNARSTTPAATPRPVAPQLAPLDPMGSEVRASDENVTTMIGQNIVLNGTFRGTEGLIIKGTIEGDVIIEEDAHGKTGTVLVTETGCVRGLISGARVVIQGTVDSVISRTHLVVGKKARILTHTFFDQMCSHPGAEIEGVIRRLRPGMNPVDEILASRRKTKPISMQSEGSDLQRAA